MSSDISVQHVSVGRHEAGRRRRARGRAFAPAGVEALERRELLAATPAPFETSEFRSQFRQLLDEYRIPQASIALTRGGETYTYFASNHAIFGATPPPLSHDSLFRLGSVTKAFTAAAIARLWQDGKLDLDASAFQILGYKKCGVIKGYDPVGGGAVEADLPDGLFDITVRDLLQMVSGLPIDIPVKSATFPHAKPDLALYTEGSYAALAFAGPGPYTSPATAEQQVAYTIYQIAANASADPSPADRPYQLQPPGLTYVYNDVNYAALGLIASEIAEAGYGLSYMDYLQTYILGPMGISPPMAEPVTNDAMVGLARTLQSQAYPTEVAYYSEPNEPASHSVFPDPTAKVAPFYPDGQLLPMPYGGDFWIESHYADGGLVATPAALTKFFTNLSEALAGKVSGPLSQKTVAAMVARPAAGADMSQGWFGMGWAVHPNATGDEVAWTKNGSLPGNSAVVNLLQDGTAWAFAVNIDVLGDGKSGFSAAIGNLIGEAAYGAASAVAAPVSMSSPVGGAFSQQALITVTDAFGAPVAGVAVTIAAPSSGPSGTFAGGALSVVVTTDAQGVAVVPTFTANGIAGAYVLTAATAVNPARGAFTASIAMTNERGRLAAIGSPAGAAPSVTVVDAAGAVVARFSAYPSSFAGGVGVAVGDLDGNGDLEVVAAPGRSPRGGLPVKIFDAATGNLLRTIHPFGRRFPGRIVVSIREVGGRDTVFATAWGASARRAITRVWAWHAAKVPGRMR